MTNNKIKENKFTLIRLINLSRANVISLREGTSNFGWKKIHEFQIKIRFLFFIKFLFYFIDRRTILILFEANEI